MKTIKIFLVFIISASSAYAQSLEIHGYSSILNNTTVELWSDPSNIDFSAEYHIKLTSGSNRKIMAKRRIISLVPNTNTLFCWTACYGPNVNVSLGAFTMSAGDENFFSSHYFHNNNLGTSIVAYTFYDSVNVADSATFTLKLNLTPSGTNEILGNFPTLSNGYPNPAINNIAFSINTNSNNPLIFKILNSAGSEVETINTNEKVIEINTANYSNGVYFINLYCNGFLYTNKKFVVCK